MTRKIRDIHGHDVTANAPHNASILGTQTGAQQEVVTILTDARSTVVMTIDDATQAMQINVAPADGSDPYEVFLGPQVPFNVLIDLMKVL